MEHLAFRTLPRIYAGILEGESRSLLTWDESARTCLQEGGEPAGAEFCGGVLLGHVLQQDTYRHRTMNLGVEVHTGYNLLTPSIYLHSTPPLCFALMALTLLHSFVAFS